MPKQRTIAALLLVLGSLLVAGAAPASASRSQITFFEAGEVMRAEQQSRVIKEIHGLGAEGLRIVVYWQDIAPSPNSSQRPNFDASNPGAYPAARWAILDSAVARARARGMRVMLTVTGPFPKWASKSRRSAVKSPRPAEFGLFMTAMGRRYGRLVDDWGIWNEPNHPRFLKPKRRAAKIYRKLYKKAQRGLRASGNGGDVILIGEAAPRGTPRVVAPLRFLRGMFCLNRRYRKRRRCGSLSASGFAIHPHSTRLGVRFKPPNRDDVTIGVLSRLRKALSRARRAHATKRRLPIYITEFGVQSKPDPFLGVSLAKQAEFRSIAEYTAYRNGQVKTFSQYLMRDDPPGAGDRRNGFGGFESGLKFADGARKQPVYHEFRLPLVVKRRGRHRVVLWGLVRPNDGQETVEIQFHKRRGAWQRIKQKVTDSRGYWKTKARRMGARRWRVLWKSGGETFAGAETRAYR
jgi:cellulase (glycosyl hydrolase family 5)